ncbi:MAG: hypothetical protein KKG99_03450 [Bacteroidetes bacterium]|nr:hypothetical protein [Bacteroidota bacterium]
MKLKNLLLFLAFIAIAFGACKKDGENSDLLDENGLTPAINNIVPDEILQEMKTLGMPINTGAEPPSLVNTYLASPFILKASNRSGDYAGQSFSDYRVTLSNQNNTNLSISLSYVNGPESGSGIGAFISGDGNSFSVFAKVASTYGGTNADLLMVISGTLVDGGINNFYYANFMLENYGNPGWIANGEGRIIYDSDGFSPIVTSMKSIEENTIGSSAGTK